MQQCLSYVLQVPYQYYIYLHTSKGKVVPVLN